MSSLYDKKNPTNSGRRRLVAIGPVVAVAMGAVVAYGAAFPAAEAQSGHRLCFTRFLIHGSDGKPAIDPAGPALLEAKEISKSDNCGPLHDGREEGNQQLTGNVSDTPWGIREQDVDISFDGTDVWTTCEDFGSAPDKLAGLTPVNHKNDGWITPDVCRNMDEYRTWWFWKHQDASGQWVLESTGPGTPT